MKSHHNQAPKHNRLRNLLAIATLGALGTAGAVAGLAAHERAEAKEAAIERQLEAIINPEIDARGSEALANYNAQPDKTAGNIRMNIDLKKGVATIVGQAVNPLTVGGHNFGHTSSEMRVVMGLQDGAPNPADTRYAWYMTGKKADGNVTVGQVQLTAPGSEEYRSHTLPGDDTDGWSASYGSASSFGGDSARGGQVSTDNRRAWAGEPHPLQPQESAERVIREAAELVPETLAELNPSAAAR